MPVLPAAHHLFEGGRMKGIFNADTNRRRGDSFRRLMTALGAVALIALATTAVGAISASADRQAGANNANKLVGSWITTVNRGPSLPPVKSLQTYTGAHGSVEVSNLGALRGPSHGAWKRIGPRQYSVTMVFFRYNPSTGAYIGTTKLRRTLQLARDGQTFTGVSVPEFRDSDGNLEPGSNTRRDAETGERINVEPIAGQR
jgi:hypothetical protein